MSWRGYSSSSETAIQYQIWCLIVIIGTTLAAVMIPLQLVMGILPDRFAATADSAIVIIFGADFFINLFRRRSWQRHPEQSKAPLLYVQGWLALDLIAAIPWELLAGFPYLRFMSFGPGKSDVIYTSLAAAQWK